MTNSSTAAALVERLFTTTSVADVRSGCEDEVVELFAELRHPLLRYVSTFRLSPHDGEEIVQEAFLALFEHLRRGKSRSNLHGWLFRVCHNLALKQVQRVRSFISSFDLNLDGPLANVDTSLNPEQLVVERQRRNKLQAVLRALPEQDRYCVCLRAEGLRYRDIAEILGISLAAVSLSLARSLARFERADQE
jgi:RNA polymerase sigma-70 factor (ECF subfamily)